MDGTCFGGALKRRRTKALVIIVKGTCHEDVVIGRNLVTLVAATPQVDDIISQAADGAAVTVSGSQNVVIDGLRLQSAGGGFSLDLFHTVDFRQDGGHTKFYDPVAENCRGW